LLVAKPLVSSIIHTGGKNYLGGQANQEVLLLDVVELDRLIILENLACSREGCVRCKIQATRASRGDENIPE
jgi:hypothetical protein